MTLATYALTLGLVELLMGIPVLVRPNGAVEWFLELKRTRHLHRLVAGAFFVLSVLAIRNDAAVSGTVAGVIRLFAWLVAIKCLVLCWWPEVQIRVSESFLSRPAARRVWGPMLVGFGLFFLWAATRLAGGG